MHKKGKKLKIIGLILLIAMLYVVLQWLTPTLTSGQTKQYIEKLDLFGPLIIIIYIIISHILAPLAGTPGVLLSSAIFGVWQTLLLIYLSGLISAVINFWISRKFGRELVIKLAGRKTMQRIDSFADTSSMKLLIVSRIFGFALFEIISYAAGLTEISFKKYFLATAVCSAIPIIIFVCLFKNINLQSANGLGLWLGAIIITGAIFAYFIKKFINSPKSSE